jgi:hypothetical protein
LAAALLGVATGLAVNIKLHGFAYLLPCWAVYVERQGWKGAALAVVMGAAAAILPFAVLPLSFPNYIALVSKATSREHPLPLVLIVLEYAGFLVLPAVLAYALVRSRQPGVLRLLARRHGRLIVATAAAAVVVIFAATGSGAGQHHLMPFIPFMAVVLVKLVDLHDRMPPVAPAPMWITATATALVAGLVAASVTTSIRSVVPQRNQFNATELIQDLRTVLSENPGETVAMGCGSDTSYDQTFYRTELAYAGQPGLIDPAALMDLQKAGTQIPASTLTALRRGEPGIWLIPRGEEPFTIHGFFNRQSRKDLFDAPFRAAFRENYVLRGHSRYFDIWQHRLKASATTGAVGG